MNNLSGPASEIFQILRAFSYTVELYDGTGKRVTEPEDASRMFAKDRNLMVALVEDSDNSAVKLFYGPSTEISEIKGLITSLRLAATKYNLLFNSRQFGKEITPKDFSTTYSVYEGAGMEQEMNVFEGMYGTTRSSYLKLENARMIVRHSAKINPEKPGARGRHVDQIFVENKNGERFLFPVNSMAPARAMTQHVNNGGTVYDKIGEQISRMAEDYKSLGQASRHVLVNGHALSEGAKDVGNTCRTKMKEMRRVFERMYRPTTYATETQKVLENATALKENGPVIKSEKLDEVRNLLKINGVDLPENVLEAAVLALEVPVVKDDSMMSLLAFVADSLQHGGAGSASFKDDESTAGKPLMTSDAETMRSLRVIANAAIKAVGIRESLATRAKPIREFAEWVGSFNVKNIINETYGNDPSEWTSADKKNEQDRETIVAEFDPAEFLNSSSGEDFYWSKRDMLDDEEKEITKAEVLSSLAHWMSVKFQDMGNWGGEFDQEAEEVLDQVVSVMKDAGYTFSDEDMMEDMELSAEDVLLPPDNTGLDLEDDVTLKDNTSRDDYDIARIKALSGQR